MSKQIILLTAGDASTGVLTGKTYRKQIVRYGKWVNPMFPVEDMILDKAWGQQIIENYNKKIVDRVPIPSNHTDDVEANRGEVVGLENADDGLYALMDIRDADTVTKIEEGLIFDVSISFEWDFVDSEKGEAHGPVLLHVALVNNPYLTGMKPFAKIDEVVQQARQGLAKAYSGSAIMLSESKVKELRAMETATVKNDKDFPITIHVKDEDGESVEHTLEPGAETQVPKDQAEVVSQEIADATDPAAEGDEDGEGDEGEGSGDGDGAGDEGAGDDGEDDKEELSRMRKENAELKLSQAYQDLLKAGKITPAQESAFMALGKIEVAGTMKFSGKVVSLASVVKGILEAGPQVLKFSEEGSGDGKPVDGEGDDDQEGDDADKKPSENLSDAEKAGFKAVGTDPKKLDEMAEKYPELVAASLSNNSPKKGAK